LHFFLILILLITIQVFWTGSLKMGYDLSSPTLSRPIRIYELMFLT